MAPIFSAKDEHDRTPRDPELSHELALRTFLRRIASAHLPNLPLGQFGACMGFSPRTIAASVPALAATIRVVVGLRPEEEMGRIDARGRIAPMTNIEPLRNRAMGDDVGETVCVVDLSLVVETTISVIVHEPGPKPAIPVRTVARSSVDLLGETLSNVPSGRHRLISW
jgi:hypothetical protein